MNRFYLALKVRRDLILHPLMKKRKDKHKKYLLYSLFTLVKEMNLIIQVTKNKKKRVSIKITKFFYLMTLHKRNRKNHLKKVNPADPQNINQLEITVQEKIRGCRWHQKNNQTQREAFTVKRRVKIRASWCRWKKILIFLSCK